MNRAPQRPSGRRLIRRAGGLIVAIAAVLLLAACSNASASNKKITLHGAVPNPAPPKASFTLTDTSGAPFDFQKQTQGYLTLLYFGYTHCPDVCPTHMATIAQALKHLPADVSSRIKVVFVTTDPTRDSPQVIRDWLNNFSPAFIGLTGSQAAIDQAQTQSGVSAGQKEETGNGDYGIDHAAFVFAYTPDNIAHIVYPLGVSQADWTKDLSTLVKQGWKAT